MATAANVSERRRAETQLSYLAFLDALTGLPNRARYFDRLRQTLVEARRDGRSFAVLVADLDGFKQVNDTWGHETGDALLQSVAQRMSAVVRESDTVARVGGDEFAIVLTRLAKPEDAALVAGRMVRAIAVPVEIGGKECKVGISIGIALHPEHGGDMDTLFARADAAMYASKHAGKNRYTFAETGAAGGAPVHLAFVEWSDAHTVGIAIIDQQHQRLVGLINRLGDDLKAGRDLERLIATLGELMSFSRLHFATEEQLMDEHGGGGAHAEHHRQEHRKLIDDLQSLSINLDEKSMMLTMRYLQEWLFRHIESTDKPFAHALQRKRRALKVPGRHPILRTPRSRGP